MQNITKEQVLGVLRHTLTFVGGLLIARGVVDAAVATEITGAVLTLTGAIWSIIVKNN